MNSCLAYSEVYEILNLLEDEYKERVPKKIIDFFEEEREKEYIPNIDVEIPLNQQGLKRETMVLLAMLNLNYWCNSEEEKQEILKYFSENETSQQLAKKTQMEEYSIDNLFKKREKLKNTTEISMIEYKETNFIQKIIWKIKQIFKRRH